MIDKREIRYLPGTPGKAKLIVDDTVADFAIKAGLATEDDLIRIKPMPMKRERA